VFEKYQKNLKYRHSAADDGKITRPACGNTDFTGLIIHSQNSVACCTLDNPGCCPRIWIAPA
jgi:hypothetical protein